MSKNLSVAEILEILQNDTEYQVYLLERVEVRADGSYGLNFDGAMWCSVDPVEGVAPPQVGETLFMHGKGFGYPFRSIIVGCPDDGTLRCFIYKTVEQQEAAFDEWLHQYEAELAARKEHERLNPLPNLQGKWQWVEGMGEISGFGGHYEQACRNMLAAGLDWLEANPTADPHFKGSSAVFGIVLEDNDDAKALSEVILGACEGCSGAMHHAAINSCMFIKKNGWDAFVEGMSKPR